MPVEEVGVARMELGAAQRVVTVAMPAAGTTCPPPEEVLPAELLPAAPIALTR